MVNEKIRKKFLDFIKTHINNKTAKNYKESLKNHSRYRYAIDDTERIQFLKINRLYDDLPVWNPATIKGVLYKNGNCELINSEIDELVIEYRVNLENEDFGLFEYEIDNNKAFGLKAPNRLLLALHDCLEQQVIVEMIGELRHGKDEYEPFKNMESRDFFYYAFENFILNDKAPKTATEYVFRQMFDKNSYSSEYVEIEYRIIGTMLEFGNFYNNLINENELITDKTKYLLNIVMNECKIRTLDRLGNVDKRQMRFNNVLLNFIANNEKVE